MIIKCKMCGGDLNIEEGSTVCECEYCGSKQTVPSVDNEKKTNLFNRANRLRMSNEFDKAASIYESIAAEFPEDAEAYWGLCLCAYGIEYVDDPGTGAKIPTCHRTLPTSIMDDGNFDLACEYADSVARKVYRDEAKAIDRIQKDILSIVASEKPYDVFICYKETGENGERTEDSVLAQDIYDALTGKGLKVFFSRITLEDKLGVQYEPYIYAALSSAKVMLAIGTKFEYYDAVWVKNEWSRYLGMMKQDKSKTLIPCFKDLDAYDMPKEFNGLQAQDMSKLGWMQDLVRGVTKIIVPESPNVPHVIAPDATNLDNLIKRAYKYLRDKEWTKATEYAERILDQDISCNDAYICLLLAKNKYCSLENMSLDAVALDSSIEWKDAYDTASEERKKELDNVFESCEKKVAICQLIQVMNQIGIDKKKAEEHLAEEIKLKEEKYNSAVAAMNKQEYDAAITIFSKLADYQDSKDKLNECIDAYRRQLAAWEETQLAAQMEKVEQIERTLNHAKTAMYEAEKGKTDSERREETILDDIRRLSNELSQVHGLFSGGKKRDLEVEIDTLNQALAHTTQRKLEYEQTISKAQTEASTAESALTEAKAAQREIETRLQKKEWIHWTDKAIITTAAIAPFQHVGSYATFGTYPQTKSGTDATPIEWLVLNYDSATNKALLISRYTLDCQPYNNEKTNDITWETCTLRKWLNSKFINTAFTVQQQAAILTTTVDNSNSHGDNYFISSNNTEDKVFLLSYAEVRKHLTDINTRVCEITDYAAKGKTSFTDRVGTWWLRSLKLSYYDSISGVVIECFSYDDANYGHHRGTYINRPQGVRPALWLDLSSDIF